MLTQASNHSLALAHALAHARTHARTHTHTSTHTLTDSVGDVGWRRALSALPSHHVVQPKICIIGWPSQTFVLMLQSPRPWGSRLLWSQLWDSSVWHPSSFSAAMKVTFVVLNKMSSQALNGYQEIYFPLWIKFYLFWWFSDCIYNCIPSKLIPLSSIYTSLCAN